MGLRFKALSGDKAADIVNAWNATKGGIDSLILPTAIFSGVSERLIQIILPTTGSLLWTFADAPGIDFVGPVWADVQVSLIGELRTS